MLMMNQDAEIIIMKVDDNSADDCDNGVVDDD